MSKQKDELSLEEAHADHAQALKHGQYTKAKNPWSGTQQRAEPTMLTMDTVLDFGKHKGKQVEELIIDDPGYLAWIYNKEVRELDDELVHVLGIKGHI